jgi:hypothetical protein
MATRTAALQKYISGHNKAGAVRVSESFSYCGTHMFVPQSVAVQGLVLATIHMYDDHKDIILLCLHEDKSFFG